MAELILSVYQDQQYQQFSEIMLTPIMGTTLIIQLYGPIASRYALEKAEEIGKRFLGPGVSPLHQ